MAGRWSSLSTAAAWGVGNHTDVANFLALLDQRVRAQMNNVSPFIVFSTELNGSTGPTGVGPNVNLNTLGAVDGHSCLNYFSISLNPGSDTLGTLSRYNSQLIPVLSGWDNRPQIACYMPDFNEKPRTYVGVPANQVRYLTDWSLTKVRQGLVSVKNYVDARNQAPISNHIMLYAWNEWREEGHVLEPTESDGNILLEQVSQVFQLDTFGGPNCKDLGNCPESLHAPSGSLDRPASQTDCQRIAGWARDPDTSLPTWVDLYRGNPANGGTFVQRVPANGLRPDLPFRDKAHGFDIAMPEAFETGNLEEIYAYAVDIGVNGNDVGRGPLLGRSPFTIRCGSGGGVPLPPTNVAATDGSFGDRIRVTWSASSGASAYEVWRNTQPSATGQLLLAGNVTGTTFDDTQAPLGVTHWYRVKAKSGAGTSGSSNANDGYRLSGAVVADFFANVGANREVGDPLSGTFTEVGSKPWTATSSTGFGNGWITNRVTGTSSASLTGGVPFQLSEHPTRRYFTVAATVDPTGSDWAGLGFSTSSTGGYWTDARVWAYLRPTGNLQVRASGTSHLVYSGFPSSFRSGRNSLRLQYDKVDNRVDLWLNEVPVTLANPDLDTFGFHPAGAIAWAGFHIYKAGGHGLNAAALDDFRLAVAGDSSGTQTTTATANADAFVAQQAPTTNFGSAQALRVRTTADGAGHFTFLRFNVPAFSGTVVSAQLRLRTQDRTLSEIFLYRVNNMTWSEGTVNWNNWGQGGAVATQVGTETSLAPFTWYDLDVTAAVTGSGSVTLGINSSTDAPELDFFSRESSYDPQLLVTYQP